MVEKNDSEKGMKAHLKKFKVLVIIFAAITVVAGVVLAGLVVEHLMEGTKQGGLEINEREVEGMGQNLNSFLGIELQPINEVVAEQLELDSTEGALVNSVFSDSPAEEGGLERGDVIVRFDREKIQNIEHIQDLMSKTSPGERVKVVVERDGRTKSLYIKLGERPTDLRTAALSRQVAGQDREQIKDPLNLFAIQDQSKDQLRDPSLHATALTDRSQDRDRLPVPVRVRDSWGMTVSPLTSDLTQRFNLRDRKGVVVVGIASGSKADQAGLRVGDLIMSVNRKKTADISSFYSAISKAENVLLDVYSESKDEYISLEVNPDQPPMATIGLLTQAQTDGKRKVAVAANGDNLQSQIAPRFGTAAYFLIVDPDTIELVKALPNYRPNTYDYRGYGIRAAQLVASHNVEAVITSSIGPQAFDTLLLYNVKIFCGSYGFTGNAKQSVEAYRTGQLVQLTNPTISGAGYGRQTLPLVPSLVGGQPETIPPMGKPEEISFQTTANQVEQCFCPVCGTIVSHPAGIPCSEMNCPKCGSRLVSANPGVKTGIFDISLTGGKPANIPPRGKPEQASYSLIGGQPLTIPPMGKPEETSYTLTGGKPETIPPMGKPEETSYTLIGGSKGGETESDDEEDEGGYKGIPPTIPPMGKPSTTGANVVNIWQIGGQPTDGQTTAGTGDTGGGPPTDGMGGKPENVPPAQTPGASGGPPEDMGPSNISNTSLIPTAGGRPSAGSGNRVETCICPVCGTTVTHPIGIPCASLTCPDCGSRLANPSAGTSAPNAPSGTGRVQACVCPACGTTVAHPAGMACAQMQCPNCGSRLVNADVGNTTVVPYPISPQNTIQGSRGVGNFLLPGQSLNQSSGQGGRTGSSGQGGPSGYCICPICGAIITHEPGVACTSITCPKCGSPMVRGDGAIVVSDQPENRPLGKTVADRPGDKPPDITKRTGLITVGSNPGKVAIPADGSSMDSSVASLFDRAEYFLIVGFGSFKAVPNPNAKDVYGVGIQSAQFVVDEGAGAVIANNISLEAMKALNDLKVKVYSGVSGTAKQAIDWYEDGRLNETSIGVVNPDEEKDEHESRGKAMKEKQKFDNRAINRTTF